MTLAIALLAAVILIALAYWELVIAEGVHLGPRVVAFLYDLCAPRYNRIKQFNPLYESWFLSDPLISALSDTSSSPDEGRPLVLDVATGTGRLPLALLSHECFTGRVIALDSSRAMLAQAAQAMHTASDRLTLIWQDATKLPFDDDTFDAVTCLEALEFMPDTRQAIGEIVRVLRPGGVALLTNRIGLWCRFLFGHTQSPQEFEALLRSVGLHEIRTQTWQVEYDLVWAKKPAVKRQAVRSPRRLIRCPYCTGTVTCVNSWAVCSDCGRKYSIASDGVIEMMKHQLI